MTEYTLALLADVTSHTGATSGAHAASAISFTPAGNIAATDVQAALEELDTELSALITAQDLDFAGDSGTGAVDLDSQSLTVATSNDSLTTSAASQTLTISLADVLEDLDTLGPATTDGEFLVATGAGALAWESGATARTSLGLGTTDTPEFDGLTISHATNGITVGLGTDVDLAVLQASVATGSPALVWDTSAASWQLTPGLIVGDPGDEDSGITINGTNYNSAFKVSSIGTADIAQFIMHRHSTNYGTIIIGSRSNSDTNSHTAVTSGQALFQLYGAGIDADGEDYNFAAKIEMYCAAAPSSGNLPGGLRISTQTSGGTLTEAVDIDHNQVCDFANKPLVGGSDTLIDTSDAASTSAQGIVELTITSEVNTGTDATRAITPDALAGSNYGTAIIEIQCFTNTENVTTGDDAADGYWRVPSELNGWNLVGIAGHHGTAGTGSGSETTDIMVHNVTQAADMLSVALTIDEDETDSSTAATGPTIDTTNDDVATGDLIRIDVDDVTSGAPKGLTVTLTFRVPT